jgi:NTE family protein
VSTVGVGLRQLLFPNGFALAKANVGYFDFFDESNAWEKGNLLSGYSLGFGYNSLLGPLELSAMYSDQSKDLRIYVNIGFTF